MNPTFAAYQAAFRPLSIVLDAVPAPAWGNASPCTEWTARQVVEHMINTQRELLMKHGHSLGPTPDITDPAAGFADHAERVLTLVSRDVVVDSTYDGFFGPTTVGTTLVQFYVWDMLVHRWDVARATGGDELIADDELDRIEAGADSFGDALHMDGICEAAVPVPIDADRKTVLLARLGRHAARPNTQGSRNDG